MYSDFFDGEWRLRYTSSRTFHRNEGLTGYAYRNPNCETPELLLKINQPRSNWVLFEEPIVRPNAQAAVEGDSCLAECLWQVGPNDALKLDPKRMQADGREWTPRDPNQGDEVDMDSEKAIRVLAATKPAYLDANLLLLRNAVLKETVFVFTKKGVEDPPEVEVEPPEGAFTALPPSVAAALAARESGKGGASRPRGMNDVGGWGGR